MPTIRNITFANGQIQFTNDQGTAIASPVVLPVAIPTAANIENYINTTWIPQNVTNFQMLVHVISTSPLNLIVGTWDIGLSIPDNWWLDQ